MIMLLNTKIDNFTVTR